MKIILNDPICAVTAVQRAMDFNSRFPPEKCDCVYRSSDLVTFVKRTKVGTIIVSQWLN